MALWSAIFRQKSLPTFSDTDPSNLIICKFKHFRQLFSLQNSKTTCSEPFKSVSTVFHSFIEKGYSGLNCFLKALFEIYALIMS